MNKSVNEVLHWPCTMQAHFVDPTQVGDFCLMLSSFVTEAWYRTWHVMASYVQGYVDGGDAAYITLLNMNNI